MDIVLKEVEQRVEPIFLSIFLIAINMPLKFLPMAGPIPRPEKIYGFFFTPQAIWEMAFASWYWSLELNLKNLRRFPFLVVGSTEDRWMRLGPKRRLARKMGRIAEFETVPGRHLSFVGENGLEITQRVLTPWIKRILGADYRIVEHQ